MGSKQVNDAVKRGDDFANAMEAHAERVGARAAEALARVKSKDKGTPSAQEITGLLVFAGAQVRRAGERLLASDKALTAERGDDADAYAERDEAHADARGEQVSVRESIVSNCGERAAKKLGLDGNTPDDPTALVTQMELVFERAKESPPKSVRKGVTFDARKAVADLPAKAARLKAANTRVRTELKEEAQALVERDRDWVDYDRTFASFAAIARGFFSLAGEDELGEALYPKPDLRASAGAKEDDEEGDSEEKDPGAKGGSEKPDAGKTK